jgi:hypothetical protein
MRRPCRTYRYRVEAGLDGTHDAVRYTWIPAVLFPEFRKVIGSFGGPVRALEFCNLSARMLITRLRLRGRTARVIVEVPKAALMEQPQS